MLSAILAGTIAAVAVNAPSLIRAAWGGEWIGKPGLDLAWAGVAFLLALLAPIVIQAARGGARSYDGLGDLFLQIHQPALPDSGGRWSIRGVISFLLSMSTSAVGPEGAALEWIHGGAVQTRPRSARWFDHRRRSDAAVAVAASVSAAFLSPFAGVLVAIEMGIGGRTTFAVISSLVAFIATHLIQSASWVATSPVEILEIGPTVQSFQLGSPAAWGWVLWIGAFVSVIGALFVRFVDYSHSSLDALSRKASSVRPLIGALCVMLALWIHPYSHLPATKIFEDVMWAKLSLPQLALVGFAQFLILSWMLASIGSCGIFWPIFALGAIAGATLHGGMPELLPGFGPVAGLIGASALWGAVLGAPLSAAVLAFELSHNLNLILPCLVTALLASQGMRILKTGTILDLQVSIRGLSLRNGRASQVLDSVTVQDAMVAEVFTVRGEETLRELQQKVAASDSPFIPVVDAKGAYLGMITADQVLDSSKYGTESGSASGERPISDLLEAKDLVYRAGLKLPAVHPSDSLSQASPLFDEAPCLPVLTSDKKVAGLLFVYHVRLAYEREVGRRSLSLHGLTGSR